MSERPTNECPPAVGAAEGRSIALGASAGHPYPAECLAGKVGKDATTPKIAFRSHDGRVWRYNGKRARVLAMLVNGWGLTHRDTLPWHTRLGGTIHVLRRDGLVIETVREGEFRHARYRLRTIGTLVGGLEQ